MAYKVSSVSRDYTKCLVTDGWLAQQARHRVYTQEAAQARLDAYNENPKKCQLCNKAIPYKLRENRFCNHSCAAMFVNAKRRKFPVTIEKLQAGLANGEIACNIGKPIRTCFGCGLPTVRKFCTAACCSRTRHAEIVKQWQAGRYNAVNKFGQIRAPIRNYLLKKFDSRCTKCGWHEINPESGKVPVQVEHIDGNYRNNTEDNLTLLCPNCHSLTPTYMALNRGKGRASRMKRYKSGLSF